jgi:hypothetical protein
MNIKYLQRFALMCGLLALPLLSGCIAYPTPYGITYVSPALAVAHYEPAFYPVPPAPIQENEISAAPIFIAPPPPPPLPIRLYRPRFTGCNTGYNRFSADHSASSSNQPYGSAGSPYSYDEGTEHYGASSTSYACPPPVTPYIVQAPRQVYVPVPVFNGGQTPSGQNYTTSNYNNDRASTAYANYQQPPQMTYQPNREYTTMPTYPSPPRWSYTQRNYSADGPPYVRHIMPPMNENRDQTTIETSWPHTSNSELNVTPEPIRPDSAMTMRRD